MKPLHELLKGKVVNCQTEEEAKELMEFLDKNDYFWHFSGRRLTIGTNNWYSYKKKTCYLIYENSVCYGNKNEFKGEKIYTYQQFKQLINENNMETKEEKSYTLDELKLEVDKFREYLLKVCRKNECDINVEFKCNEAFDTEFTKRIGISTKINIY